jgi:DNA-binding NarL/FixJ family response regulator
VKSEQGTRQLNRSTAGSPELALSPQPTFTGEESTVMRAFAGGRSIKQVCADLRIPLPTFYRLLRNLMEKTGTRDQIGLLVWAVRQKQCGDSRKAERNYRWRQPCT